MDENMKRFTFYNKNHINTEISLLRARYAWIETMEWIAKKRDAVEVVIRCRNELVSCKLGLTYGAVA